ncbi:hypothetical protein bmyco0003_57420 [Bacillus pseudomycoides]|nr:hypothetical protein bmyco0003_57420 [Bacillus pseudomycoides]
MTINEDIEKGIWQFNSSKYKLEVNREKDINNTLIIAG